MSLRDIKRIHGPVALCVTELAVRHTGPSGWPWSNVSSGLAQASPQTLYQDNLLGGRVLGGLLGVV
jgi:hypothetical protein